MTARAVLVSLRPQEWVKNLLVYAGLLFSGQVDQGAQVLDATLTFVAFCAISSAGYVFNDLHDREHDRLHPEKRRRPIASGTLTVAVASVIGVVLAAAGVAIGLAVELEVGGLVALYGAITAAYSAVLKRLVILDVMTIASLFILRVVAGAVAVEATASEFLLICTAMLALFLGFTKRRQEALLELPGTSSAPRPGGPGVVEETSSAPRPGEVEGTSAGRRPGVPESAQGASSASGSGVPGLEPGDEPDAQVTRPVLEHYSLPFLDQMIAMVTAAAILSYVIYAVDSPLAGSNMLATAPPVLYGIFRYLYLIYDRRDTRSTAAILTEDPGMILAAVTWIGAAVAVLYVFD